MTRFAIAWAACAIAGAACGGGERAVDEAPVSPSHPSPRDEGAHPPASTPAPTPTDTERVAFRDGALTDMYARARACIERRAPRDVWSHHAPDGVAGVREERWCAPDGPCVVAGTFPLGQSSYHLRTLTSASGETEEERLELVAHGTSVAGWITTVWLQPWTGGFSFSFTRGDESYTITAEQCVPAMDRQLCAMAEPPVHPVRAWHEREVRAHTTSATALRDRALAALSRLRAEVERAVAAHSLTTCPDPSAPDRFQPIASDEGTGLADACARRPLTRAEEQAVLRDAHREIAAREALVRRHHVEWHAALTSLFPFDECWLGNASGADIHGAR